MPDLSAQRNTTVSPRVLDGTYIGTAAGTTTILSQPGYIGAITVNQRAASGAIVVFDSIGTSGTILGSIVLGTQTFSDPQSYPFNFRTRNGLSVSNSANVGITVSFGT